MLDLIASLQLVPAARALPVRGKYGSLSGQLALLFHQVDTGQYSPVALLPMLTAVMESRPDVYIWDLVYLSIGDHRVVQREAPTNSNTCSDSALHSLVQCITMTEARAATAEERLKQLQSRMEVAMKLLPDLIASMGTDAATVIWSMFSDVHNSIDMPDEDRSSDEDCSSVQSSEDPQCPEYAALQTYELVEQILLHLPMLDLLHCQRVCTHWKGVIDSPPVLQQALYFRPGKERKELPRTPYNHCNHNEFNPLLQEVFVEWFTTSGFFHRKTTFPNESVAYIPVRRDDPEIFRRPEASWRRMLFQQDSEPRDTMICYKRRTGRMPYEYILVQNDYTMGEVYDLVNSLTTIPRGDDLHWLYVLRPGSSQKPRLGRRAEELVQKQWMERQLWCEKVFGMADNAKISDDERQIRDSWCKRHPRTTRRIIEWEHREYRWTVPVWRWWTYGI